MTVMPTLFKLDHEELSRCALELRDALRSSKHREIPYLKKLIDQELEHLQPLLDLCIAKGLEEPFPLLRYVNPRVFGDVLDFPEFTKPYHRLVDLMCGGMSDEDFWSSEYYKQPRMPRQLRQANM